MNIAKILQYGTRVNPTIRGWENCWSDETI